jgi:hypothetical protein
MMIINTDEEAGSGGSPHQEGQICTVLFFKIGTILYCTVLYCNVQYCTVRRK